jgi:hypothetical protein
MERSKAESFTAYLEAKQRMERSERVELSIRGSLSEAPSGRMALVELQAASGMRFVDFAEALKRVQASGHLNVIGVPGREMVELVR